MNEIMILNPYKFHGQWVFDDESTNLCREAFIAGIDKMLDRLTENIPNSSDGVLLTFSRLPFPGYGIKLIWKREESGGNWYYSSQFQIEGWLCPALFKYFETAPKEIYAKVEAIK